MMLKRLGRYEQLILSLLSRDPLSLYQVYQKIAFVYRGYSDVSSSTVYKLALGLHQDSLLLRISTHKVKSKEQYSLSDKGLEVLKSYSDLDRRVALILCDTSVGNTEVKMTF